MSRSEVLTGINVDSSRDLTELCGVTNFGMADLTRPDPGRLRSQLSGIMNFAKFRSVKSLVVLEYVANV